MAYYRTGSERTVVFTASLSAQNRSNDLNAPFDEANGSASARMGARAVSGIPAPLCNLVISGGSISVSQGVDAQGVVTIAAIPGTPHDITYTATASITFSIVLQQVQSENLMTERVKPGAHHTLAYNFSTYGASASGTLALTEASTTKLLVFADYGGQCSAGQNAVGGTYTATGAMDLSGWQANFNATGGAYTNTTATGSAVQSSSVSSTGVFAASVVSTGTTNTAGVGGSARATAGPRLDVEATIAPYFFDMLYGGTYKVLTSWSNTQTFESDILATGSLRSAQLYGPFTGQTTINETPGGLAYVGFTGTSANFLVGDRCNGLSSWRIVSPSTTSTASPIAHPDHPDGDIYGVRQDQSNGLQITHDGARTIEDGSTITPSGGEWVSVSGGGSVTLSSGIRMAAGGSSSVFRRGWAVWSFGTLVSGAILDTRAHRFVTLTLTTASAATIWVHLPGATTAIYGQGEGDDPGSSQGNLGGKRWKLDLTAGTNTYRIDLCNPDYWPLGSPLQHIDPPYETASGSNGSGPPEGFGFADYPAYRDTPSWQAAHGNFSGQGGWSRMAFILPASSVVTVNSIVLDAPEELCVDSGEGVIAVIADGMLVAQFSALSGVPVSTVRANIDAVDGLTCTTSLTNGAGSAPAAYSLRSDWEQWRGGNVYRIYWGGAQCNVNRRGASAAGLDWPLISPYIFWHPGGKSEAVGSNYGAVMLLTLRARFGGSFFGMAFREEHAMGDGSVAVAGDASYAVDSLGRWGYGDNPPRIRVTDTHVIIWDGWSQQAIKAGAGTRGVRRWTSFKGAELYVPYQALSVDTDAQGRTAYAAVRGGDIVTGWSVDWQTTTWEDKPAGFIGTRPCLRFDTRHEKQRCYLLYESGGAILLRYSDDEGATWSTAMSIWASGRTRPAGDVGETSWLLAASRSSGGAIEVKGVDRSGNILFTATAVASGVADDTTPLTWDASAQRWYLLYLTTGGAVERVESADQGKTWT
jgi:hypothetical protein